MKYDKYDWFYGAISYKEAEALVCKKASDGCFLVRISSSKMYYVLTLLSSRSDRRQELNHFKILQTTSGKFHLQCDRTLYSSLAALIEDHCRAAGCLTGRLKCTPKSSIEQRKSEQPAAINLQPERKTATVIKTTSSTRPSTNRCDCRFPWEILASELEILSKLGNGSFGVVHQARLRRSAIVAVKTMINGTMSEEQFIKEAAVMTELKHPHIVRLCGVVLGQRPICIVTEFMKYGCLVRYLMKYKPHLITNHKTLLNICAQVSRGMAYLEEKQFVHRDLAARNCLVGTGGIVKVSDFGMSKFMCADQYQGEMNSMIPLNSCPPEVIQHRIFSSKSDVWAFGLLMWEVFTCGEHPFRNMELPEILKQIGRGFKLNRPPATRKEDYAIMLSCWEYNASDRPTFAKLKSLLDILVEMK